MKARVHLGSIVCAALAAAYLPATAATAGAPASNDATTPAARAGTPGVPATRIYWGVDRDGRLTVSDMRVPGAVREGVHTYPGGSSPEATERALREREYWRRQDEAFAMRQLERNRELEQTHRLRLALAQSAPAYAPAYPRHLRAPAPWYGAGAPYGIAPGMVMGYGPAPGVAAPATMRAPAVRSR